MTEELLKSPKKSIDRGLSFLEKIYSAISDDPRLVRVYDPVFGDIGGLGKLIIQNIHLRELPTIEELTLFLGKNQISYSQIHTDPGCPYIGFSKDVRKENGIYVNFFCPRPENK